LEKNATALLRDRIGIARFEVSIPAKAQLCWSTTRPP
jgi:hypothetical protein